MSPFTKLSPEILRQLRDFGFVHMTGLKTHKVLGQALEETVIQAKHYDCGLWNIANNIIVLVFHDGQVWVAHHQQSTFSNVREFLDETLHFTMSRDNKLLVPCSSNQLVNASQLLLRTLDPYEESNMSVNKMFGQQTEAPSA